MAIGAIYGATAITTLPMGSTMSMGPGYFPAVLSVCLVLLGAAIALRGLRNEGSEAFSDVPWRAIVMISLAVVCFALLVRSLGLFATVWLTTLLACLSNGSVPLWKAAILGLAMAALCTLIFSFGIGLPIPIFGPWLRGLG